QLGPAALVGWCATPSVTRLCRNSLAFLKGMSNRAPPATKGGWDEATARFPPSGEHDDVRSEPRRRSGAADPLDAGRLPAGRVGPDWPRRFAEQHALLRRG